MRMIEGFLWGTSVIGLAVTLVLSLYGIAVKPNLIKKLIALTILGDTANLIFIVIGYRLIYPVKPPILPVWKRSYVHTFVGQAVDPLPQALVLTAVVIGMAVNVLIAFAIIQLYRTHGSVDVRSLGKSLDPTRGDEE